MPATGQKVCGGVAWCGGVVWWFKPILVFSLAQAEQQYQNVTNLGIIKKCIA